MHQQTSNTKIKDQIITVLTLVSLNRFNVRQHCEAIDDESQFKVRYTLTNRLGFTVPSLSSLQGSLPSKDKATYLTAGIQPLAVHFSRFDSTKLMIRQWNKCSEKFNSYTLSVIGVIWKDWLDRSRKLLLHIQSATISDVIAQSIHRVAARLRWRHVVVAIARKVRLVKRAASLGGGAVTVVVAVRVAESAAVARVDADCRRQPGWVPVARVMVENRVGKTTGRHGAWAKRILRALTVITGRLLA